MNPNPVTVHLKGHSLWPTVARAYLAGNTTVLRSEGSRQSYESVLVTLQRRFPDLRVNQFTQEHLESFLKDRPKPLAPKTMLAYRSVLVSFFAWAKDHGYVPEDVAFGLKKSVPMKAVKPIRDDLTWLDEAEVTQLLALCPDTDKGWRDRVAMTLLLNTGLRCHEAVGATWGRLSRNRLQGLGKGEKPFHVGINPDLATVLAEWRARYQAGLGRPVGLADPILVPAARPEGFGPKAPVETVRFGVRLSRPGLAMVVRDYGRLIGVRLAPHDLRRTFAQNLLVQGYPLDVISQMMRHDSVATTQMYLKQIPARLDDAWASFKYGA